MKSSYSATRLFYTKGLVVAVLIAAVAGINIFQKQTLVSPFLSRTSLQNVQTDSYSPRVSFTRRKYDPHDKNTAHIKKLIKINAAQVWNWNKVQD